MIQTFLDEFVWRFNNDVTTDRVKCYDLILETLVNFYEPGSDLKKIEDMFNDTNGDPDEEESLHFVDDDDDDDSDDESDDSSQDDVGS